MPDLGRAAGGPHRASVMRSRLIDQLEGRFSHRLTVVVAGGGAGKTTLLHQAADAEMTHLDAMHSCTAADRDGDRLVAHVVRECWSSLGAEEAAGTESVEVLSDLILSASPRRVCLVLDDTHRLDDFDVVAELLERLPGNAHILLAGRRRPNLDTARLDAAGELLEIRQDDLLMTAEEQIEFARMRGVDVAALEGAEGWPAFVELASAGGEGRSRRYLEEEALASLARDRRTALARFAFVGGGDDEMARAVAGLGLDELIHGVPLVRWRADHAQLHDLWAELLDDELSADERASAAMAASRLCRERRDYDRAIDLARAVRAWDDLFESLGLAIREGVDGGLRSGRLERWRSALAVDEVEAPIVTFIDGLIEREADPTSEASWILLDRAALAFQKAGDDALHLAALLQLGYAARIRGEAELLDPVVARLEELVERYPPAAPFLHFAEAWSAMSRARPDLQLAAMERLSDRDLPPVWRVTRDHLHAHALNSLGRPREGLDFVPRDIETLAVPIPGALVTESQCLWASGQPHEARRRRPGNTSAVYGARDLFIAGAWNATMHAYAGDVAAATAALELASQHAGEQPSLIVTGQTIGVSCLVKIAEGRDADAAEEFAAVLEFVPLGGGVAEQMVRNNMAVPYVLLESTREFWDQYELGPALQVGRDLARAFVADRERDDPALMRSLDWPDSGVVASHLPCPWAVEFAIRAVQRGRSEGRRLAAWLCEHWGEPARKWLRHWLDDDELGTVARELLASIPSPPPDRVAIRVLGPTTVAINEMATEDPNARRERVRALLASLVVNPTMTREQLGGVLWPDHPADRAAKNLRTTLAYAHGVLEPRRHGGDATWCIRVDGPQIQLHHELDVDLWRFTQLLDDGEKADREGSPTAALPLLLEALALWQGDLMSDLDLEWLELDRIHVRSRYVSAASRAAELLVATRDPEQAIAVIRPALKVDPWSERSYLALADAYTALGDHTSAKSVLDQAESAIGAPVRRRTV